MIRLFFERSWQGIPVAALPVADGAVAGRQTYSAFYQALASGTNGPDPVWVRRKRQQGEWILREFLERSGGARGDVRVLSIGAGRGEVERPMWERGYRVDAIECEPHSLREIRASFPRVHASVADARALPLRSGAYDLVYMSAIDYCFDRAEYDAVLAEAARVTRPGGVVLTICVSNLSAAGLVRGWLSGVRRAVQGRRAAMPWGFQRTVGEHIDAGHRASLRCAGVYLFDHDARLAGVRKPDSPLLRAMTSVDRVVAVAFTRTAA